MKKLIILFLFAAGFAFSQSIVIDDGAEINIQSGSDLCASNVGNITGNITGIGTQCNSPLPVALSSFSYLILNNNQVKLVWRTVSESNNKGFEISRSNKNDITKWNNVGFVNGAGNSAVPVDYSFMDARLSEGKYYYRIKQIDFNGNYKLYDMPGAASVLAPLKFFLGMNYPNPFNASTKISYQLPHDCMVTLKVYDVSGKEVQTIFDNLYQKADYYTVTFNAANLASGVYFYFIKANSFYEVRKMLLVK